MPLASFSQKGIFTMTAIYERDQVQKISDNKEMRTYLRLERFEPAEVSWRSSLRDVFRLSQGIEIWGHERYSDTRRLKVIAQQTDYVSEIDYGRMAMIERAVQAWPPLAELADGELANWRTPDESTDLIAVYEEESENA